MNLKNHIKLMKEIISINTIICECCGKTYDYIIETADTNMVSCYCGSVYSFERKTLVISVLSIDEYNRGCYDGGMAKRIEKKLPRYELKAYKSGICPYCESAGKVRCIENMDLEQYCEIHSNTMYMDENEKIWMINEELKTPH